MSFTHKVNRGSMFKGEPDDVSDYSGNINIEGVMYFINGFINDSDNGKKYLGISIKKKDKQPEVKVESGKVPF